MTTTDAFTIFPLTNNGHGVVGGVTTGADGLVWFARYSVIGNIRP